MNYYEIGQKIRKKRKALGLSQEELAEKVEISTTHMSHIETGNTKLSLAVFVSIAEALSCQTDELLYDIGAASKQISSENILLTLERCTAKQLRIIEDIIVAAKAALDKNA
ncbi:MAG: helix-turn-helix transcriptional regulator [Anaerovoracaceae bacterium]|nr:helix-turn-helix transcriptional regulator [Anaerovoracaceae bacterium]